MSFTGIFEQGQPVTQTSYIGQPADDSFNLVDRLHIRHMERMLENTLKELEQVKSRVSQLEKAMAKRGTACGEQHVPASLTPPLPIAEISQIAEMAKRFR